MSGAPGGPRPDVVGVVLGTGTEVGKTWVTCALVGAARAAGLRVAARKPAQSFDVDAAGAPTAPTDADLLGAATGEDPHAVCPPHRWYPVAMAPPMAADVLGRGDLALRDLLAELRWEPGTDVGFVETAGGTRSPVSHDADCAELAAALEPDVALVVADAGLGTVNATRLAVGSLHPLPVVVVLNRFDPGVELHVRNRGWLEERDGIRVVVDVGEALDALRRG